MRSRVGIFGCGQIGSASDELFSDDDPRVLSHARACILRPDLELVGLCDLDRDRVGAAGRARGLSPECAVEDPQALLDLDLDVAVIAASTDVHLDLLGLCITSGVPLIVCEKPVGTGTEGLSRLLQDAEARGVRVVVNYMRRFLAPLSEAVQWARDGGLGALQHGTVRYPKGLLNCGSHGLDLLGWLLGAPESVRFDGIVDDGRIEDPTLVVTLRYTPGFEVRIQGVDHRSYTLFEMDLLGSEGRLQIDDLGRSITRWSVEEDPTFPGYRALGHPQRFSADLGAVMAHAWAHVSDLCSDPTRSPLCGLEQALNVHRVIDAVVKSRQTGTVVRVERS